MRSDPTTGPLPLAGAPGGRDAADPRGTARRPDASGPLAGTPGGAATSYVWEPPYDPAECIASMQSWCESACVVEPMADSYCQYSNTNPDIATCVRRHDVTHEYTYTSSGSCAHP